MGLEELLQTLPGATQRSRSVCRPVIPRSPYSLFVFLWPEHLVRRRDDSSIKDFKSLRAQVRNSMPETRRHLSLGWIGIYELPGNSTLSMAKLTSLWESFRSFLIHLEQSSLSANVRPVAR